MSGWEIAALVVAWALAGGLTFALVLCVQQYGKALVRIDELHGQIRELYEQTVAEELPAPQMDRGLEIGAEAPSFELPDLAGNPVKLTDYRGDPFVLTFFSPTCGYCVELSPYLGQVGEERKYVVVTHGDVEQNRRLITKDKWNADVVHADDWDMAIAYDTPSTPSAYLIDEEGRIASPLVIGVDAVVALQGFVPMTPQSAPDGNGYGVAASLGSVHMTASGEAVSYKAVAEAEEKRSGQQQGMKTRDVSESKIVRDGLPKGTIAPTFLLPDLEGETHSLAEFRGKRVLLVFSDVDCGPCKTLAPRLVKFNRHAPDDLRVIMISRGDVEQNRQNAEEHGYDFPVLLQRSWEVSKLYGIFATPVGYLIDEDGVLVENVATGTDAIMALVS
jgi:peroxiredoxin